MRKVFISRKLDSESFFQKKMLENELEVFGESLLEFLAVPFERLPEVDWIFFYSQNGVRFFFENISKKQIQISPQIKFAGFGAATAQCIESFGKTCDFVGTGNAETTATQFLIFLKTSSKNKKVLFPRAENSRKSVQQLIENQLITYDLIVYKNFPKENIQIPEADYLIFTSPMNAQVFFSKNKKKASQKVFAIGKTTAAALQDLGIEEIFVAKKPTEEALVNILLENF